MKNLRNIKYWALGLIGVASFTSCTTSMAQRGGYNTGYNNYSNSGVSFQMFYDELSPYGQWVNDPNYGYVWIPDAGPDFQPYATNGYWSMTDYGNTWVSNYDWGWAPFHYGRWNYNDRYGWGWVPDYEWGPAWVNWRQSNDYYGWAPLGPGMNINVSVNIPMNFWTFVSVNHFMNRNMDRYYVNRRNYNSIYNRTTVINNTTIINNNYYVGGPRRSDIERYTGRSVTVNRIANADRPGSARSSNSRTRTNEISMYRPTVDRNTRSSARPTNVVDASTRTRNNNSAISDRNNRVISNRDNINSRSGNRELYIDNSGNASVRSRNDANSNGSTRSSTDNNSRTRDNGATNRNNVGTTPNSNNYDFRTRSDRQSNPANNNNPTSTGRTRQGNTVDAISSRGSQPTTTPQRNGNYESGNSRTRSSQPVYQPAQPVQNRSYETSNSRTRSSQPVNQATQPVQNRSYENTRTRSSAPAVDRSGSAHSGSSSAPRSRSSEGASRSSGGSERTRTR
ncbi:DUF6600 domain-containing protein [Sphingobacterium sp. DR205]|uniref:DUF6600 domain-containing protein n=1 Tax=Sphingobacterium sp. DR205 TaxID=2713573 RepID=UPI0013E4DEBC|nr:DUF6600 domain-containing protein [Sphingobacterium sp. DR205]QIH35338.1 hypothetical protein G6053_21735 [Sphingobacterium sp. DR205]